LGQEGIASLERAFLLAGAKSVIASLWTADDIFTSTLMRRFFQHLVGGEEMASALHQAKLDLLEEFGSQADVAYWGAFTLVGDGRISYHIDEQRHIVSASSSQPDRRLSGT
jgi:CHAT domain-containing protein